MNRNRSGYRARRPGRCGVTLAELLVVLAMLGLVGSTIGVSLVRQQRFYRGATELLRSREEADRVDACAVTASWSNHHFRSPEIQLLLAERSVFGCSTGYPAKQISQPISDRQNFI